MRILVIRHAIAEDRDEFSKTGKPDGERPLTKEGIKKMEKVAKWLAKNEPTIDAIWTSPLTRAQQTAQLLAKAYRKIPLEQKKELEPEKSPDSLLKTLQSFLTQGDKEQTLALVGHEPHLSRFVAWLLTGQPRNFIKFKKAGVALIETENTLTRGSGELRWLVAPKLILMN